MKKILIEPLITEKSLSLARNGWFTFRVGVESTKRTIAQAVEEQFPVHVRQVRTIATRGKTKRVGKLRLLVKSQSGKKALVKLKDNEKIDLFGVETQAKSK